MKKTHLHFIGIKGVGMAALAIYAKEKGFLVTGSDTKEEFVTEEVLKRFKIPYKTNFNSKEITAIPDLVIVTGAHGGLTNPEATDLAVKGVKVITHGEAVGQFMQGNFGISVAGVGGKTTTSAMAATLLTKAQLDPSYVVGVGNIFPLNQPGHFGKSKYFIAEADEYASCPVTNKTPRFHYQFPNIEIITNIIYDHPDLYDSIEDTFSAFYKFSDNLADDGFIIINNDNENNRKFKKSVKKKVITYGFTPDADFQITNLVFRNRQSSFQIKNGNLDLGRFNLVVPGKFNVLNAAAVVVLGIQLGLPVEKIKDCLVEFKGTMRRFEIVAEKNNSILVDDYAHHPSEIQMTLLAAKQWFPHHQIICIFQPHTYSRTKALFSEFSQAFGFSDELIILPIFASAREKEDDSINSRMLVNEIAKFHSNAKYANGLQDVKKVLSKDTDKPKVIITMGAGDVYKLGAELIEYL